MTIKLGIIGLSEGNGHPYSWSAIFNGYDPVVMEDCGYDVISRYLEKQSWPQDSISEAKVTHIWTQDSELSEHIAKAALIPNVVQKPEDMIGSVDGVLLARDDADMHYEMALPFLDAGLPVYIDKPISLSIVELDKLFKQQQFPGQIFSCSALRYAREFHLDEKVRIKLGTIRHIHAMVPKDWDKYAVHIIEPLLVLSGDQGRLEKSNRWSSGDSVSVNYLWESGFQATVSTLGSSKCPLSLRIMGDNDWCDLMFGDTFYAFRSALEDFVNGIVCRDVRSDPVFLRLVVDMIELGKK